MTNIFKLICLFCLIGLNQACVKSEFDEPTPGGDDPTDIQAEDIISLEEVMALWQAGEYVKIGLDKYVQCLVAADDESGNFFKTITVQDENSSLGIAILTESSDTYTQYPVGRRVFVHLKDLWISDYRGLPQLGYGPFESGGSISMAGIPSILTNKILRRGKFGFVVEPVVVKINQLNEEYLNRLIKIENSEFVSSSAGKPYANVELQQSLNHTLKSCDGGEIIVRSSAFANFASELTPTGNGSLIAVYTVFGNTKQLVLRNTSDLIMSGNRCGSTGGDVSDIKSLRTAFNGGATAAGSGKITGVVVSDRNGNNLNAKNLYIQDASGGILIRFTANHTFNIGDELEVDVTGIELSEFNGLLQLNNTPNGNISKLGTKALPLQVITIKELLDNFDKYESTRIQIKDASITGGSTFGGGKTVTDASGSIAMFTQNAATFASAAVPTGNVSVIAIASEFNSPQIILNSAADVTGGGNTGGDDNTKRTIQELRSLYTGSSTLAPAGYIEGVVTSDFSTGHLSTKNVVIQDGEYGIVLRFTADPMVAPGKKLKIKVSGVELSTFNELLQLNNVPNTNILATSDASLISPKEVTISELTTNFEKYESTLVKIANTTLSGAATYSGTLKVTDATGVIDLFTRSAATFAGTSVPTGTVTVTAIASQFKSATTSGNGYQLTIRDPNDVK